MAKDSGIVKESTVPMPASFLYRWMKPRTTTKYGLIGEMMFVVESPMR